MDLETSVLIVVDMQNGFVTDDSAHVVPVVADVVRRWQAAGGRTILTRYHNYPNSPFERLIGWYGLHEKPETELIPELEPYARDSRIIDKTGYTAFTDEGAEIVRGMNVTDVLVCGIATDGCVLKTVLDAFEAGYVPWLLADACASNATRVPPAEVHRSALLLASRLVGAGQVIPSAVALADLPVPAS